LPDCGVVVRRHVFSRVVLLTTFISPADVQILGSVAHQTIRMPHTSMRMWNDGKGGAQKRRKGRNNGRMKAPAAGRGMAGTRIAQAMTYQTSRMRQTCLQMGIERRNGSNQDKKRPAHANIAGRKG
jgi:hypothetical protein